MRKKRTSLREWTGKLCQIVRIMKITLLLVFLSLAQLQASVSAQLVSVEFKNASLQEIFEQVKRQTGVSFMFSNDDVRSFERRDFKVESADVNTVMERCLAGTGLTFEIVDNVVIVKKMELQADGGTGCCQRLCQKQQRRVVAGSNDCYKRYDIGNCLGC